MEKLVCQVDHIWVVTEETTANGIQNFKKSLRWGLWKLFCFEIQQISKDDEVVAQKVVPN